MFSPQSNERMVEVMQSLGRKVGVPIATFIGEMQELDDSADGDAEPGSDVDPADPEPPQPSFKRDPELEREEQLISVIQEKKKLEARLADVVAELGESQQRCLGLEDELAESKYALDRRRGKAIDDKDLEHLNERVDRDKEYIAGLESEVSNAKSTIDQQQRQLDRLKGDASSKQDLRDELQVITAERDELRQRSKANENLKKKIQSLQEQEKVNQSLRHELQLVSDQLQEYEALRDRCTALEKANDENAQTIANGEQEIFDQKTAKRMLEHELKMVAQKWEQSKELLMNAQETIHDLEERLIDPRQAADGKDLGTLDDELAADSGAPSPSLKETRRRSGPATTAEAVMLQQSLGIASASVARLEQRCLDLLQENLALKAAADGVPAAAAPELHPFQHQARRLEGLQKELEDVRAKFIAASMSLRELRQLAPAPRSGQPSPSPDARAPSGDQDKPLPAPPPTAQDDGGGHQRHLAALETDLADARALLRASLLRPAQQQVDPADPTSRAAIEYRLARRHVETAREAPAPDAAASVHAAATALAQRVEGARALVADKEAQLLVAVDEAGALRARVEALVAQAGARRASSASLTALAAAAASPTSPTAAAAAAALEKGGGGDAEKARLQLERLARENRLVASAWYDLTCRLQSNAVHLARRAEGARGWLGRMRAAVNHPARRS
jgi:protein HOOK3